MFDADVLANETGLLAVPFGTVDTLELERGVCAFLRHPQGLIARAGEMRNYLQDLTLPIIIFLRKILTTRSQRVSEAHVVHWGG